ncbi:cell wall biogenesis protein/glutathione transferase [Kalaharituber pfeilii]|nr:cell wall biogenesis protein/glutathione transferase [Kalaharituber pfeilii]
MRIVSLLVEAASKRPIYLRHGKGLGLPSGTRLNFRSVRAMTSSEAKLSSPKITDWADSKTGEFHRKPSAFRNTISRAPGAEYHLYVSYACPWAHRTLIVRELKGLQDVIGFTCVHWHLTEGGWHFAAANESLPGENVTPEPFYNFPRLRDLYFKAEPNYSGRFTVPVLWDKQRETIVNNESAEIIRMLYTEFDEFVADEYKGLEFLKGKQKEVDELNAWIYNDINNGVYKCGFATTQQAYDNNIYTLFSSLDRVESILSSSPGPYLLGAELTEADIRLYTTIARFDPVYVQHFKCNLRDIRHGYPAIHKWLRHLYWDIDAFRKTTEFEHIKLHYTKSHSNINPHGITPAGPVPHILPKD